MSYSNKAAEIWEQEFGHEGDLVVRNWYKYQMVEHKFEFRMGAIFTSVNCVDDPDYIRLSLIERAVLDELRRAMGRVKKLRNDFDYLCGLIGARRADRRNVAWALLSLRRGFSEYPASGERVPTEYPASTRPWLIPVEQDTYATKSINQSLVQKRGIGAKARRRTRTILCRNLTWWRAAGGARKSYADCLPSCEICHGGGFAISEDGQKCPPCPNAIIHGPSEHEAWVLTKLTAIPRG
jgi:hypothetical protein